MMLALVIYKLRLQKIKDFIGNFEECILSFRVTMNMPIKIDFIFAYSLMYNLFNSEI